MIVYIESNFVLEIALLQEEYRDCRELLDLAERHNIKLIIPAYCVGEPYEALGRRLKRRRDLHRSFLQETNELSRSKPYRRIADESTRITTLLIDSIEDEKTRLDASLKEILSVAKVIPIGIQILKASVIAQEQFGFEPQDSIVYASVVSHLRRNPHSSKCFLNKNSKDFMNPDVEAEMGRFNCRVFPKFSNGLGFIRSHRPVSS